MNQLEKQVVETAKEVFAECIPEALVGYNKPLTNLVSKIFTEHESEIQKVLEPTLLIALQSKEFRGAVQNEFQHKVAKMMVSNLTGAVEKAVNAFRNNPVLKSKMILAIETMIEKETKEIT